MKQSSPPLGGEKSLPEARREITWNVSTLSHLDPRTNQSELEVQRIIHLQGIANQLPDVFTDSKKIVKSHILAANNPVRIEVPEGQLINIAANESKTRLKCGRLVSAKDKIPRKRKIQEKQVAAPEEAIPMKQATNIINLSKHCTHKSPKNEPPEEEPSEEGTPKELSPEEEQVPENDEISIHYVKSGFAIVAVYVDDLNLVGTPEELTKTADYLKNEFEMKDLEKVLKHFHMDKAHPLSTPMVVRSLDVKKDPFRPQEVGEETLGPEVPYLSAIRCFDVPCKLHTT
uniref:Reverse transcriptase Ty1/copia-type domain-containing protein n=1 Tax=Fagus sylvatica TaxID=28930 RepID=A0A2N9ITN2_FAGSY